jgi:hypothetical protein
MTDPRQRVLDEAYEELESELPSALARALCWLRAPERRWARISLGLLFIVGGLLWFLPVVGVELLAVGLLILAHDVPFMRAPVGRAILWAVQRWRALKLWWRTSRELRRAKARRNR